MYKHEDFRKLSTDVGVFKAQSYILNRNTLQSSPMFQIYRFLLIYQKHQCKVSNVPLAEVNVIVQEKQILPFPCQRFSSVAERSTSSLCSVSHSLFILNWRPFSKHFQTWAIVTLKSTAPSLLNTLEIRVQKNHGSHFCHWNFWINTYVFCFFYNSTLFPAALSCTLMNTDLTWCNLCQNGFISVF